MSLIRSVSEAGGEPLEEDEREDVVLDLRGVQGTPDLTCRIPEPLLQSSYIRH